MNAQTDRKEIFESIPVPSALRVMIVPAVISQLIVLIYNMAAPSSPGCWARAGRTRPGG